MNREQQIEWEARSGRPAAAAAAGGAILLVIGFASAVASLGGAGATGDRALLLAIASHEPEAIIATAANALAALTVGGVLLYLFLATKPRRPEVPDVARGLAVAGPLFYAGTLVVLRVLQLEVAHDFVALPTGFRTEEIADSLLEESAYATAQLVGLAPSLALGFAYVLISLNAMRAGLLSRFMGILGIIVGVLYVIPLLGGGPPIVTIFWTAALAVLFLGRWPGGRGPAWASGEAIPWPSAMEAAKAREAAAHQQAEPQEPAAAKPRRKKRR